MFAITDNKDNADIIVLSNAATKTFVEIIPSCGAILNSFNIRHQGSFLNVIDGYTDPEDFKKNVTAQGFKSCKLSPFACRIKDSFYTFNGATYVADKFLLGRNAIHGLIYDAPFSIVSRQADENSAELVLKYEYRAAEKGYPFNYDCIVTYQLKEMNELLIDTKLVNMDTTSIPVQDGWHPYFTLGKKIDELELTMPTKEEVVFDEQLIPTGTLRPYTEFVEEKKLGSTQFDNCFSVDFSANQPFCVLKDAEHKLQVEIRPARSYPYLQVYTPPHRNSIAIENLSAPPDAFNNGINLILLSPGENTNFETSYIVTSLK